MGLGFLPGLGLAYAVHLHHTDDDFHPISIADGEGRSNSGVDRRKKTRFEFYKLLPEMEVVVSESELARRPVKPTPGSEEADHSRYVLQAGAFRRLADADRLKASLALSGFEARIQSVAVDGQDEWHRVRLGPYNDLRALNEDRTRLRQVSVKAMVLRIGV